MRTTTWGSFLISFLRDGGGCGGSSLSGGLGFEANVAAKSASALPLSVEDLGRSLSLDTLDTVDPRESGGSDNLGTISRGLSFPTASPLEGEALLGALCTGLPLLELCVEAQVEGESCVANMAAVNDAFSIPRTGFGACITGLDVLEPFSNNDFNEEMSSILDESTAGSGVFVRLLSGDILYNPPPPPSPLPGSWNSSS